MIPSCERYRAEGCLKTHDDIYERLWLLAHEATGFKNCTQPLLKVFSYSLAKPGHDLSLTAFTTGGERSSVRMVIHKI